MAIKIKGVFNVLNGGMIMMGYLVKDEAAKADVNILYYVHSINSQV